MLVDTEYVDDRCPVCHLDRNAIERMDRLIVQRKAESLSINNQCGHTMAYRSLGLWTAATPLSVAEIRERCRAPIDPTLEPTKELLEHEHVRLMIASKTT